ncbi:D-glycero-beta-D-manno-heptose 1,7-bisphosphate 7-phosphatase [Candidatus Thioglobus sp.]|nr:D-glycero-beta-D-manno-heptose 1,7-bisphosphate 7-phosphatase [Candidatus Thioglobus sp.]
MSIKTIFLDRDGVINKEQSYLFRIKDFIFIDGVFQACQHFAKIGYKIVIVTNQSGISRGYYSINNYETLTHWMLKQFKAKQIDILDVFHCPHGPEDMCECRKPMPGMFFQAQNKHNIDMKNSWLIGDKEADIIAAKNSGINNTILVKSGHKIDESKSIAKYILNSIKESVKVIID